ncbi:MAG: hypothetical protein ACYDHY_12335 [Acidiferrobacterales bacterium]
MEELLSVADPAALPLAEIDDLFPPEPEGDLAAPALPAQSDDLAELLSIDHVLLLLMHGDVGRLDPWIDGLALRVLPLLEFCNRERGLGLDHALSDIRNRLAARR